MQHRLSRAAVVAILCLSGRLSAQGTETTAPEQPAVADSTVAHRALQSSIDRPSTAVRRKDVVPAAPLPASSQKLGEAKAEMIVGGAAFIAGALMDNDAGSVLMLGGAIVGLYGLWNYLK